MHYTIYVHVNIFWIGLKIIEGTKYELKKKKILISKIYNNISNLNRYMHYPIYPIHASSIKTTTFRNV